MREMTAIALVMTLLASTVPAEQSEVESRLASELIEIEIDGIPLVQSVYRILGNFSLPVTIRWPEDFEQDTQGIILPPTRPTPVGEVLRQVLLLQELDFTVTGSTIEITRARDRICKEREASEQRFLAIGIRVDMTVPKVDRCESRAMIDSVLHREGDLIAEQATVALIQKEGVVFLFEGFAFELRTPGASAAVPPENERGTLPGEPSPDDYFAFEELGIKVSGIFYDPDDSRASFAIIGGNEVSVGGEIKGALVEEIRDKVVTFSFRGHEYRVYLGE